MTASDPRPQRPAPRRGKSSARGALALLLALVLALAPSAAQAKPGPTPSKEYTSPPLDNGRPAPSFDARAYLVGDLDSGRLYASHDPDRRLAPASVMKLLTGVTLVDVLSDKRKRYTARPADSSVDGTKVGLMEGNAYTVDQLFHAMLMSSANDAAFALGNAAGGQDRALGLMRAKAKQLGLTGTVPMTLNGLDAPNQSMTVHDLFIIARAVVGSPYLMRVIGTQTYTFPGGKDPRTKKKVKPYEIQNHTKIVGAYPGGLGLKNGYTIAAKGSFVCAVKRGGRTFAAAVLSSVPNPRQPCMDLIGWALNQRQAPEAGTIDLSAARQSGSAPPSSEPAPSDPGAPQVGQGPGDKGAATPAAGPAGDAAAIWSTAAALLVVIVLIAAVTVLRRRRRRPEFSSATNAGNGADAPSGAPGAGRGPRADYDRGETTEDWDRED
ncbi:D-alanyl-D-alanine carboxypeptidase [Brevibacterium sp. 5221]|uniref:D-alanyl-D-alanine carboxypeptidase n=1 Tax=Brevibacterium rongguiense TaxID=2695267 RepID=A0A6N9H3B1_9MICO|nr:D-alanyl-D-alanine carboxypeptidase [Brevibacterium rongguiense]MYM18415.1 D-alanyl-D-alanine carboxypeptidase [Brevibacterium rongguiense]